ATDPAHCGSCSPCPMPDHGVAVCSNRHCGARCEPGYTPVGTTCVRNGDGGSDSDGGGPADMARPADMPRPADLAPPHDLTRCGAPNSQCMNDEDCCSGSCKPFFPGIGFCA